VGIHPTYAYPDASVICGPTLFDELDPTHQTATSPRLIAEVLGGRPPKGTTAVLNRYMQAESLEGYVLVEQDRPHVKVFFRQAGGT
jgi:Uma2 family endonuclease